MAISIGRVALTVIQLFLLVVVTMMFRFQCPELRYDFGSKTPVMVEQEADIPPAAHHQSVFVSLKGTPDPGRAAVFAKHGVPFTYFMLEEYGTRVVVRTPEQFSDEWVSVDRHVGRMRAYATMPFRRSIRAGFRTNFDVGIPEDALFLARDDVPKVSGWSVGATIFAGLLWVILAYFFFLHRWLRRRGAARLA